MKLIAIKRDGGEQVILDIEGSALTIRESKELNVIRDGNGTDHYFDREGYYDGYGKEWTDA